MSEILDDGVTAYTVGGPERVAFANGQCAIQFTGGTDGPLVVVMPEDEAVQTAVQLLVSPGKSLQGTGVALEGTAVGRDPSSGQMILTLHFQGGGRLHVVFDAERERQFYDSPRLPPLGPRTTN